MKKIYFATGTRFYVAATFPATVSSQFKLDLKGRVTANKIKCKLAQTASADLLPNEFHATANVSLLARLQKLSTATLMLLKVKCVLRHLAFCLLF